MTVTVSEKVCPFCGSTSLWLGEVRKPLGDDWVTSGYQPSCMDCKASIPDQPSKAKAIAAWNRRTAPGITEANRSFLVALLASDTWIEAGAVWDQNPVERNAALAAIAKAEATP